MFTSPHGARLNYHNTYNRVLTPVLVAASEALGDDVTWAGWHAFRHTAASRLIVEGRSIKQVQEWLGHHKASFTYDTYVHLLAEGVDGRRRSQGANRGQTKHRKRPETLRRRSAETQ